MTDEQVMVVQTAELQPFLTGRFIRDRVKPILDAIGGRHFFVNRKLAEVSPQYRQIIPYVVIRHEHDYFVLQRLTKQSEARLHHKLSLGIGGHVNPGQSLVDGMRKELEEEVRIESSYDMEFLGIINDDSTDVGRVHLGAAYRLDVQTRSVTVLETDKMTGQWMPRGALREVRPAMESWSQIVYDACIA